MSTAGGKPDPDIPVAERNGGRLRIVLFANTSWYLWNFRRALAQRLIDQDCQVVFIAPPDKYSERLCGIAPFVPLALDRKSRNPLVEFAALARIVGLLRRLQPDVVLTWTPKPNIYGSLAARVLRIPCLPNVAGLGHAFAGQGALPSLVGFLYWLAFRRCPRVFFQNAQDRDDFIGSGRIAREQAVLLPGSGIDLQRFSFRPSRHARDFIFLFASRLLAAKGVREFACAAKSVKTAARARIWLAGAMDEGNPASIGKDELRAWVAEGAVEYLGHMDDIASLIADADCVVLPSYYKEGVPRILLEAAACGRPVITTDAPGCRDAVVPDKTGFLCRPRDVGSLAEAMRKMISQSPADRAAMGRAAREHVERNFSEEIVIGAYLRALKEIAQFRNGRARAEALDSPTRI